MAFLMQKIHYRPLKDRVFGQSGGDYSKVEIKVANMVLQNPVELVCDEAIKLSTQVKYDVVLSNSVFSYFESYEYAESVLEIMYKKANHSIGIIDIHDIDKEDAFFWVQKEGNCRL